MRYDYICQKCSKGEDTSTWVIWEVNHPYNKPPKMDCPKCGSDKHIERFFGLQQNEVYIRGNGWLDVKGRRRDMHLWKLMNDDPYASMRPPGDKEELAAKLRKGGKHNPNGKNHYMSSKKSKPKSK
jgi:hypothetical protein